MLFAQRKVKEFRNLELRKLAHANGVGSKWKEGKQDRRIWKKEGVSNNASWKYF